MGILPLTGAIGPRLLERYYGVLTGLERAKNIKGVLLMVESPGGSATASELLYERLQAISAKKPLYAYCMMAASGGYLASLAARKIFLPHTGAVGSIGVLSIKPVLREFFEKIGLDLEVLKKGRMKDMSFFHREFTEEERLSMEALNEAVYERFVDLVAQKRNLPREKALALATGELFPAKKALSEGLVDGIRGFDEVLSELSRETGVKKERAFFVRPRKTLFKKMMEGVFDPVV